MKEFELGYFAGILEGEGCFSAQTIDNSFDITLQVSNNSVKLVRWLQKKIGGKVRAEKSGHFSWLCRREQFVPILEKIRNRLIFKQEQCDSFLLLTSKIQPRYIGIKLSKEVQSQREMLLLQHKKLLNLFHEVSYAGHRNQTCLVSVSGGMDSVTLLYFLKWKGLNCSAITFNYGQKHKLEIECAKKICYNLNVEHQVLDISKIMKFKTSCLTSKKKVPEGHYSDKSMRQTVVPNRNMILTSFLAGIAVDKNIKNIAYGAHKGDESVYPDCRPMFVTMLDKTIESGNYNPPKVLAPFLDMDKSEIAYVGNLLKVPYQYTHTCYNGKNPPCGKCGACNERAEAFAKNGLIDPLVG